MNDQRAKPTENQQKSVDVQRDFRIWWRYWLVYTILAWSAGFILGLIVAGLITTGLGFLYNAITPDAFPIDEFPGGNIFMGMTLGLLVGFFQGRLLKPEVKNVRTWALANGICLGGVFFVAEILSYFLNYEDVYIWIIIQTVIYLLAGFLAGIWQSRLGGFSSQWIIGSAFGWGSAILITQLIFEFTPEDDIGGLISLLASILLGGLVLGLISGWGAYHNLADNSS